MNTNRKSAIIVGVLYIIGTVAGVLSVVFTQSTLNDADYLVKLSANGNQLITGALFVLIMGLALALIPVVMFPILKRYNEVLALGYVVFRGALETFTVYCYCHRLATPGQRQPRIRKRGSAGCFQFASAGQPVTKGCGDQF